MRKLFKLALPGAAMLGLTACATGFPAQVERFEAMPAPQGETFVVVPMNPEDEGGLRFSQYAAMVADELAEEGYRPAAEGEEPTMIVQVGYGVDEGRERIVRRPGAYSPFDVRARYGYYGFYDPWYRLRARDPFYWSRHRYYGRRASFYYGWDDPFWYSPWGEPRFRSFTEYQSELEVDIRRAADNQQIFEGTAKARSRTDDLGTLVPNLITAMFTDFPGNNGKPVKITVKPEKDD